MAAALSATSDQAAGLLQNLSLDNPLQDPEPPTDKTSAVHHTPVDKGAQAIGFKPFERSATSPHPDFVDQSMFYSHGGYPSSTYYYQGFSGSSVNDWDWYGGSNGIEMAPGAYGDYQNSYGYAPYGTYSSPGSTVGHDNPMYGPQSFQYPTCYFQPSAMSNGPYTANTVKTSQADVSTPSIPSDMVQLSTGMVKENQSSVGTVVSRRNNVSKPFRSNYQDPSVKSSDFFGRGSLPSANLDYSSAFPYGNNVSFGRNQNLRSLPHPMGMQHPQMGPGMDHTGFMSRMYPSNRIYGQYARTFRHGTRYVSNGDELRKNDRRWLPVDNMHRLRGRGSNVLVYSNGSVDGLNELNKGPRSKGFKDQKDSVPTVLAVNGQSIPVKGKNDEDNLLIFPDREQYNRDDFPEQHSAAKFFIIKSYSEDDVHKSIKYGVWASTPNGNKKLDAAYKEAQEISGGCPVFLLFSVNASGQFVGLAEMVGPVDFDRSVEYWQQDKWTGCFPVKWHIIKDVPNSLLKHITLENNENKPVTNSRDTQEVRFDLGTEIIKIFKGHSSRTCILDDFGFYEGRQKAIQDKKAKHKQFSKQVGDVVSLGTDEDGLTSKLGSQKSVDLGSTLTEDSTAT
ncbi:hypothetical protein ACH5RR_007562 [Cinchona calisaya]|uniref:YTH domain-containing family protein n=1 Tax=Cinchona calisaya TaxID=153742 RepID=A0ABD3ASA0_9GENT